MTDMIERVAAEEDLWDVGSCSRTRQPSEWYVFRGEHKIETHEDIGSAKLALRRLRAQSVASIVRAAAIEECAKVAEGFPRNRDWVNGSLYDTLRREVAADIRALAVKDN